MRPVTPEHPPPAATRGLLLRFWGVRGSIAVPGPSTVRFGGNTACVEVRYGREIVILDAGTGIRELGMQLAREFAQSRRRRLWILITHTHWDHIQGFPFFAPAYLSRQRIRILGWRGSRAGLLRTVAAAVESPYFPVGLRQMPGSISIEELKAPTFRLGIIRGRTAPLNHPGGGVGFRLDTPAGSVAYVPDHEVHCPPSGLDASQAARPSRSRMRVDKRVAPMLDLIRGVDVLIHDAQYTAEEYATRVGWGHSCVESVVRIAAEAGVRHLVLFHHDPKRDDARLEALLRQARQWATPFSCCMSVDAAREGLEIELPDAGSPPAPPGARRGTRPNRGSAQPQAAYPRPPRNPPPKP